MRKTTHALYSELRTIVTDLMVINVSKTKIRERRAVVSDYSLSPALADPRVLNGSHLPKYNDTRESSPFYALGLGPLEQLSPFLQDQVINPCLYDPDGWDCEHPSTANNPPPNPPGV